MTIAFIRGQYINNFELQSYYPMLNKHSNIKLTGFSSLKPKHKVNIPTIKLPSPVDLPEFPKKLPILNRLIIGDAMYLWGLENKLKGYEIAHVRETYFHFSSQAIYAKKMGYIKKVLTTCSETIPFNHESIWGRKKLKANVLQNSDHFHCLTNKAKKCLITEGVNPDKITVIPYGVDIDKFKPLNLKRDKEKVTGLFIGRLESQKGVEELLQAYRKIKSQYPNFLLRVVGKGPIQQSFIDLGINPKSYPYSNIPNIMNQGDFLILPSKSTKFWEEYLGMVILESMACGLPVLTTDCGAIPEVVGQGGFIVKQGDSKQLYAGIKEMIENTTLRKRLSALGLTRVKKYYDASKQSEKIYQLYQDLI